jgi:hypothetical protein
MNIENQETGTTKKKFQFKQYYANNPAFRQRHLEKMREKVQCECGRVVSKYNLHKHQSTKSHQTQMEYLAKLKK